MNYSIILNRHAGNGNAEKAWSSIKPVLDQQQIDYHMEYPLRSSNESHEIK